METKRLFLGLLVNLKNLPELEQALKKLKQQSQQREMEVKWSLEENLHITLKFLGSVEEDRLNAIQGLINKLAETHEPFEVPIEGLGGFPSVDGARSIWAGVKKKAELVSLHEQANQLFSELKIPREDKQFIPHVTLGRIRNKKKIRDFISPFVRKKFGKIEANKLILYESVLQGYHPKYIPLYEVEF